MMGGLNPPQGLTKWTLRSIQGPLTFLKPPQGLTKWTLRRSRRRPYAGQGQERVPKRRSCAGQVFAQWRRVPKTKILRRSSIRSVAQGPEDGDPAQVWEQQHPSWTEDCHWLINARIAAPRSGAGSRRRRPCTGFKPPQGLTKWTLRCIHGPLTFTQTSAGSHEVDPAEVKTQTLRRSRPYAGILALPHPYHHL
jgi:hypothetical protein